MSEVSGSILRLLLSVTKIDILRYAQEHNIAFREDASNQDTTYDRNRIRRDIIPVLEALNPSIHESVGELATYMQNLGLFLLEEVSHWLLEQETKSGKSNTFSKVDFGELSPFFQGEIISYLYRRAEDGSTQ
jgi:tRNA(Ile)-lysidine synthase TilS/MesJ